MPTDTLLVMDNEQKNTTTGTDQIRLPKPFLRRLRRIAGHLDRSPQDYLMEAAEGKLSQDEAQMLRDLQQEQGNRSDQGGTAGRRKKPSAD